MLNSSFAGIGGVIVAFYGENTRTVFGVLWK